MNVPRVGWLAALALAVLALSCGSALAAAGDLDPSFDGDGKRVFPFPGVALEALVQPDGKIVLAGTDLNRDFALWRLNRDGSLDSSFDGDGSVLIDFGGDAQAYAAALQPDGKIVVAGSVGRAPARRGTAVARLNTDGSLDSRFDEGGPDGDGKKVIDGEDDVYATAVAVAADGDIVLAGPGFYDLLLTRLDSTGAVDGTTFEDPAGLEYEKATDVALQPDGRIVVIGTASGGINETVPLVLRYLPEGPLDQSFADGGVRKIGVEPAEVLVRPDGRIVVAGNVGRPDLKMAATQLTPGGDVDKTFGAGGTGTVDFPGQDYTNAAALQPDGKVIVAGATTADHAFAIARLGATGTPDPGFGAAGKTTLTFGAQLQEASAVALQPDGKLVVAGVTLTNDVYRLVVARLLLSDAPPVAAGDGGSAAPPAAPRCAGRRATIVGTPGRDTLRGSPRADVIVALGGNDRVLARGGNDIVCGGAGNDRLSGGAGRDRLLGERGRDLLTGGRGRDRLIGGPGRDHTRR